MLGDRHDAVVAEAWLRDTVVDRPSGRQSLVAGLLVGQQRDEVEARRRAWPGAWKELDKPKLRAWMRRHG